MVAILEKGRQFKISEAMTVFLSHDPGTLLITIFMLVAPTERFCPKITLIRSTSSKSFQVTG